MQVQSLGIFYEEDSTEYAQNVQRLDYVNQSQDSLEYNYNLCKLSSTLNTIDNCQNSFHESFSFNNSNSSLILDHLLDNYQHYDYENNDYDDFRYDNSDNDNFHYDDHIIYDDFVIDIVHENDRPRSSTPSDFKTLNNSNETFYSFLLKRYSRIQMKLFTANHL